MALWERVRRLIGRARNEAADVAQFANLKLDIRGLEGQCDHLLRDLGRKACALQAAGRGLQELAAACEEIARLERRIAEKEAEMQALRERRPPAANEGAAAG